MIARLLRSIAVVGAVWMLSAGTASAQAPVLNVATNGNVVTLSWSATAGAAGYRLDAGYASGNYNLASIPVGPITALSPIALPNGVYFVRIVAIPSNEASAEVRIQLPPAPAAPTNLQVARNGNSIVAAWTPGAGGGAVSTYQVRVGLTPGATNFIFPTAGPSFVAGPVPTGTFYLRVVATNAAGVSDASNEVTLNMVQGACDPPPSPALTASAFSTFLSVGWAPIPGVSTMVFDVGLNGSPYIANLPLPAAAGGVATTVGLGTYTLSGRAVFSCGSVSAPSVVTVVVDGAPPAGPRQPNPAPGTRLPQPSYLRSVVEQAARDMPGQLANSCVEHGGNNRFLFELTRRLRAIDNRWGNNIKRTNQGLSQDVVTYNNSALPDEGVRTGPTSATLNMYMYDVIGGHCGSNPGPNWQEVHSATIAKGEAGQWTLQYYLRAGYTP